MRVEQKDSRIGLYVHIPFCVRRCTYCDFNTYAGLTYLQPAYITALKQELCLRAPALGDVRATTLYIGGGTPSLLPPSAIVELLAAARHHFRLTDDAEITMEANPGTVDADALCTLREAGINRISFGVQSANDDELALLGRIHTWSEAVEAVQWARQAEFDNLSLDLIYGLPQQTLAQWTQSLDRVLALEPNHLSLYALTLEADTPLAYAVDSGALPVPDADLAADMYEAASERLLATGFWQYEISNWAQGQVAASEVWALPPNGRTEAIGPWVSQHNLIYWRSQLWIGLGAGAYSHGGGRRWSNLTHPQDYVAAIGAGHLDAVDIVEISPELAQAEMMMMGLRLAEGISNAHFQMQFGKTLDTALGLTLRELVHLGLIYWDVNGVRLTARGRLLGNRVFGAFLP